MSDYRDNFVFYDWVTDLFREQEKNLEGAEYFERVYETQISRSTLMARYALLQKAQLLYAHNRPAEALQTLMRLKSISGGDPLLTRKVQALESVVRR
jgi:hypothetical protein